MKYYPEPYHGINYHKLNQVIEEIFSEHGKKRVQMPPKLYVTLEKGDFRTMPAYLPALEIAGVKIVNVYPMNREKGLPTVMALTIILDIETGIPIAIVNATKLTDMRTGAAGAVATKYLAPKKEISLGIVGSGRQADAQIAAISTEMKINEIKIWSRNPQHAAILAEKWRHLSAAIDDIQKVCDSDVIVTVTPAIEPIIKNEWIHEGTHINAIGADAPGKEELDPIILQRSIIFVDDVEQAIHSGEINVPLRKGIIQKSHIAGTLGEVVLGLKGRISRDQITIFDSTGLAIQDLAIAHLAMQNAESIDLSFPV